MRKSYIILIGVVSTLLVVAVITTVLVLILKDDNEETTPPEVTLKNGEVLGSIEYSQNHNVMFYSFKGIPYAQPPIGDLRFSPPLPAEPWNGTLNAKDYGSRCVQFLTLIEGSEDCLTINVFTPSLTKRNMTVMVWVHGGAFILGEARQYPPDTFMEEGDVVLVTFNYRLGIFGFFSTEDEVASGNQGLKDQILALKWVQVNIEQFGGSPDKVTVFGESAGSASISYLLQTPLTTGLFRAAIMQSGCTLNLWSLGRGKKEALLGAARVLGINATDSPTLLEEFRKVPYQNLSVATSVVDVSKMFLDNPFNGLLFSPSIEPESDEAVITGSSYEKMKNGQFQKVPMIVGFNSEEGLIFYSVIELLLTYNVLYTLFPERYVPVSMHVEESLKKEVGRIIRSEYFTNFLNKTQESIDLTRFISEHQFERGINKYVEFSAEYVPVYFYRFSYHDGDRHILGAGHAEELLHLFGHQYSDLTQKMVKLWSNFAKYLNPTPEVESKLEHTTWVSYNLSKSYLDISTNLNMLTSVVNSRIDFWDNLYKNYGNEPFDTY